MLTGEANREKSLHASYQIRLLLLFAVTFSLAGLSGPLTSLFHLPALTLPSVHANASTGYGQWYPAGSQMQTLSLGTFAGAGALFTGATTGQVDTGDWPLTASQQASACPSTSILECSQPVADHGYFEIQFDLSNPLWGVRQDFGTSLGGIELRQGIGHMVDKQNFAATNAACNGVACTPNDAAMPICVVGNCNNGGLYAANPCNWDTKYSQTGAAWVVGDAGGTSYNCSLSTTCPGTVSGIGGRPHSRPRPLGCKHFCAAGNHFPQALTHAGVTGVTLNANCELNAPPGGWPAKVTAFGAGTTGSPTCSGR